MSTVGHPDLSTLPVGILVGLGVLVVVELALDVTALIDLSRRPVERVALGNKWVWVAIIVLVNPLGAILSLVLGRRPAAQVDEPSRSEHGPTDIADALYGPRDDSNRP